MDVTEITSRLCVYDKRNPNFFMDEENYQEKLLSTESCSCDNCFYGRHELADELLKQRAREIALLSYLNEEVIKRDDEFNEARDEKHYPHLISAEAAKSAYLDVKLFLAKL